MPETGYAPGRVTPYSKPLCQAVYDGPMSAEPIRCSLREHKGTDWVGRTHQAELPPLPGRTSPRTVTWL